MGSVTVSPRSFVFTWRYPDATGIVAAVRTELANLGGIITEAHHYRESVSTGSILRIAFEADFRRAIRRHAEQLDAITVVRQ
jgi:formyltetrahydrofolate hydrolase